MTKQLVMGNEAVAYGAILKGVNLVSGYPGTPSTEILETVALHNPGDIYVEWSVNEKAAMEVAAGASYAGGRTLVTMKQVGLNVASDPLMSLAYVGVGGGMVVAVADDPGPISSQTEQDTRHYGKFANLPVLDPATPQEAFVMVQEGFDLSEKIKMPVILRLSTRVCHACATLDLPDDLAAAVEKHRPAGFVKSSDWVIFPALAYRKHLYIERILAGLAEEFSESVHNQISGSGTIGIAAGGNAYNYVLEAVADLGIEASILKIGTPHPFPQALARRFLTPLAQVLVVEELDPVIEEGLLEAAFTLSERPAILGKKTGHMPVAGELTYEIVMKALAGLAGVTANNTNTNNIPAPALPARPPVLCAGCSHRAAFYAVKTALNGQDAIFTGDIGCYTLGNAKPLEMVDTCLCMGAGLTIAQGLQRMDKRKRHIAFIGDSTFFHTGLQGVVNAVYNQADITIVVLDNSTTAMTGHQPHPGTGLTMMKNISGKIDIVGLLSACGIKEIETADPLQLDEAVRKVKKVTAYEGPSALVFRSPCIALLKNDKTCRTTDECLDCRICINEIGCPALTPGDQRVVIEQTACRGCSLCRHVCPYDAIEEVD